MAIDERQFAERPAFITGAGSGFGQAFADALADRGAPVIIADIDMPAAQRVADALRDRGRHALAVACDVADEAAVRQAVDAGSDAFGPIAILLNNAGLHGLKNNEPLAKLGMAAVRRMFDVNVMGVFHCALACRAGMAARGGGTIVNISSIGGYELQSSYGVSKLAVRGATAMLAHEFGPDAIRVNAIAPGLIITDAIRDEFPKEWIDRAVGEMQVIHRTGEVRDVVDAMLYLCSDAASFITGETLRVAGGRSLGF